MHCKVSRYQKRHITILLGEVQYVHTNNYAFLLNKQLSFQVSFTFDIYVCHSFFLLMKLVRYMTFSFEEVWSNNKPSLIFCATIHFLLLHCIYSLIYSGRSIRKKAVFINFLIRYKPYCLSMILPKNNWKSMTVYTKIFLINLTLCWKYKTHLWKCTRNF